MTIEEAYRILEVAPGASEDVIREARKTLAKVWHPDRHANDPELQKRAQSKLADVNAAFEELERAGFPAASAKPAPEPAPAPKPEPKPPVDPKPVDDFAPPRRVRWSVILVLAAALGIGAYVAITKLGASKEIVVVTPDAAVVVITPDAAVVVVEPDAQVVAPDAAVVSVRREKTFTLGSSREDVIAAQGQPNGTRTKSTTINGVRTASATLTYGDASTIDFDGDDKVIGWSEGDSPLHVRLDVRDAAAANKAKARGTLAVGDSVDDVLGVLGPPTGYAKTQWAYGSSTISFEGGKVSSISQGDPAIPTR
jgi:hypothetical protein